MKRKTYREIEEKDIERLLDLEKNFPNPWPERAFFIELEGEFNKSIGLEVDDILVGYIFYSTYPDEININHFVIDPKYRRMGYASDILEYLFSELSKKQLVYLEVNTENTPAINLYKKFGLEIISTRKNYYGQGIDAFIMKKDRREALWLL